MLARLLTSHFGLLPRFFKNRSASVAPLFGLAAIPLIGSIGAAVDYSRANSVRGAMQTAGDATALMLAKTVSSSTSGTQVQSSATAYFNANFNQPDALDVQVTGTYGSGANGF